MKRLIWIGPLLLFAVGIASALAAQDPLLLLEKAIYAEETQGDLNAAIGLYQQIVADAEAPRPTSALALFRFGICYQKSGSIEQARAAFAKLLKQFPEQQDLIAIIPLLPSNRLDLNPVPWADGEELRLAIKFKGGLPAGELLYRFKSAVEYGKTVWNVESNQNTGSSYASALADAATFIPIRSFVREGAYTGREYRAEYNPQQVEWTMKLDGAITKRTFPITRTTYDSQQLVQILRCLPLHEGFQLTIPVFLSNSNQALVDAKIEVVARETVTVPAGTFECYKTALTRGNEALPSVYWISDDAHAYIVKINESRLLGGTVRYPLEMELIAIDTEKQAGQPVL
jgi:tetratricopeptide (TPR) repeat protein